LLALTEDPIRVSRIPPDRVPAIRAAIRALHRDLAVVEEALAGCGKARCEHEMLLA
jgi:hypothetical protein